MKRELQKNKDYLKLFREIKQRVLHAQIKASVRVNSELICMYWELGDSIVKKQAETNWGDGLIVQLSKDLTAEFPDMSGFSQRNIKYIRQWYKFYNQDIQFGQQLVARFKNYLQKKNNLQFRQQLVAQSNLELLEILSLVPWGHHIQIISNCKEIETALFYIIKTIENSWSRSVLVHQIELKLYERQGKSINNFRISLPKPDSDLAIEILKNPYTFDFLNLKSKVKETELQNALLENIKEFLMELGYGFAFIGKQKLLSVGGDDFYIDLVFYHTKIHCYLIVELKIDDFKPEYSGKLNFYLNTFDSIIKTDVDKPTIGLLLCKKANRLVAEYSLKNIVSPIGISEYLIPEEIPQDVKKFLPTIEEIEHQLII